MAISPSYRHQTASHATHLGAGGVGGPTRRGLHGRLERRRRLLLLRIRTVSCCASAGSWQLVFLPGELPTGGSARSTTRPLSSASVARLSTRPACGPSSPETNLRRTTTTVAAPAPASSECCTSTHGGRLLLSPGGARRWVVAVGPRRVAARGSRVARAARVAAGSDARSGETRGGLARGPRPTGPPLAARRGQARGVPARGGVDG